MQQGSVFSSNSLFFGAPVANVDTAEPNTSGFDFRDGLATLDLRFGNYTMIAKHSDEIRLWLHAGDAGEGRAEPLPFLTSATAAAIKLDDPECGQEWLGSMLSAST